MLPNTYSHPSLTPLDPAQWAETLKRKALQDQAERQARQTRDNGGKMIPTLDQLVL